jgi:hypothetical protein
LSPGSIGSIQLTREISRGDNAPSLAMKSLSLQSVIHFREVTNGLSPRRRFKFQRMGQDFPFNSIQSL